MACACIYFTRAKRIWRTHAKSAYHGSLGFKHRFTNGEKFSATLFGVKQILERRGSLQACFSAGLNDDDDTILPALSAFTRELSVCADNNLEHLVPSPIKGSACKRLNLFLRWMVRSDEVDPGGWEDVPVSKLIVPIDTHMHRIGKLLGITARNQAHMGTADRAISDLGMSVRELARRLEMNSPGVVFLVERGETLARKNGLQLIK